MGRRDEGAGRRKVLPIILRAPEISMPNCWEFQTDDRYGLGSGVYGVRVNRKGWKVWFRSLDLLITSGPSKEVRSLLFPDSTLG